MHFNSSSVVLQCPLLPRNSIAVCGRCSALDWTASFGKKKKSACQCKHSILTPMMMHCIFFVDVQICLCIHLWFEKQHGLFPTKQFLITNLQIRVVVFSQLVTLFLVMAQITALGFGGMQQILLILLLGRTNIFAQLSSGLDVSLVGPFKRIENLRERVYIAQKNW